jgi:copper chaperone NosL
MRRSLALLLLIIACAPALGPQPIAYDREACAHCHMLISDPSFAAQIIDADGRALSFDDPGCLVAWLAGHTPPARIYFHHHTEDRWLTSSETEFVGVGASPMGYGLAVVSLAERHAAQR